MSIESPSRNRLARIVPDLVFWAALLIPAILAGIIVCHDAVNIGVWDDWERGPLLRKWYEGTLGFSDLYAAHIQHRMVLPRLLIIASSTLGHGDIRWEIGAIFAMVSLTAVLFARLIRISLGQGWVAVAAMFFTSGFLFSPMKFQTFLWANQTGFAMPSMFLALGLTVWASRLSFPWKCTLSALCAIAATHTFAHGMLLWVALLPFLFAGQASKRSRAVAIAVWLLLAGLVIGLYFHDLHNTSHPIHAYQNQSEDGKSAKALLADPARASLFFLRLLGSPLSRGFGFDVRESAGWMGGVLLGLSGLALGFFASRARDPIFREQAMPWIVAGLYALLCAAAVTWGRAGVSSANRALPPRYIEMTQYLPIALCALGLLGLLRLKGLSHARWVTHLAAFLAGVLALMLASVWIEGRHLSGAWSSARHQARAQLSLIRVAHSNSIGLVDGDTPFLTEQVEFLDSKGLIQSPPLKQAWLDAYDVSTRGASTSKGGLYSARKLPEGGIVASGFGYVPGTDRPADAVLLCSKEDGRWRIRAAADFDFPPGRPSLNIDYEFTHWHRPEVQLRPDWKCELKVGPAENEEWSAWILDSEKWKVYRILGDPLSEQPSTRAAPRE